MARGPDGQGGGAGFSLSDQLFNADSIGDLAGEYSVLPGFDAGRFQKEALGGFDGRGLLERLDWIASCVDVQLPSAFAQKAEALEAAMPTKLDPSLKDDDFGRFIHAVPGILAVRHGMEDPERALDLIYEATQRFSMEFYIRPFLTRHHDKTLERLQNWTQDQNYHVRRLVSEGTRPRLPWAGKLDLDPKITLGLLDALHADPTRYVTRSVANHLNDLSKTVPDQVLGRLQDWASQELQDKKELDWLTRHALRTAIKRGERGALDLLGYRAGSVTANLTLPETARIGEAIEIAVEVESPEALPVMIDYRLRFARPSGDAEKVFKLKATKLSPGKPLRVTKQHKLKGDASTFQLHPGRHGITIQVNGIDLAKGEFDLIV